MTNGTSFNSEGTEICNLFAMAFSNIYNRDDESSTSYPEHFDSVNPNYDSIGSIVLSQDEILKKLRGLDKSKGAGPDGIPPLFIVNCASTLVIPLKIIFNKSVTSGRFPQKWKLAKVVPIFKNGDRNLVTNYRPVSILSAFGKLLESLLCPYIQRYFEKVLCEQQHGFVKLRSTCTNLVSYIDTLSESMDQGVQVDAVYTDFSKAFDRVAHGVLINKLSAYGVSGRLLDWFQSYLSAREFYVVVNGFQSSCQTITSGVPQGSHLGPILFNIFINDVITCFQSSTVFLFADDIKIIKPIASEQDALRLQQDIDSLFEWCSQNCILLNCEKCSHIKFSRKLNNLPTSYNINGTQLSEVNCIRDLGILLDSKLTFIPHIDGIIKKALRMLGFVIRNSKIFKTSRAKITLYYSLVRSIVEYCSVAWRPHYAVHSLRIERVQKRFINHLSYSFGSKCKNMSYLDKLSFFKMKSLEKRRDMLDLKFIFKLFRNQIDCPELLSRFCFRVPRRPPRKPITPLAPPLRRTKFGANSPIPRLCRLVNEYSDLKDIHSDSLATFIRNTKL